MVNQNTAMNIPTGQPSWTELAQFLQMLFSNKNTANANANDFTLGQGANANTAQGNYWDYQLGQGANANNAQGNYLDYQVGQGANANNAQGNYYDFTAAMAGIGAGTGNNVRDNDTRVRLAMIDKEQTELDRNLQMIRYAADDAWRKGESDKAYALKNAEMQLEREKFGLVREQQAYDNGMTTAQFLQSQQEQDRRFGLDTAQFNSDEANRTFNNGMMGAQFQQNQQQFDQQHALNRSQFGLQQQQAGAQQALDYNRFGLEQQRFALDRDKTRAEMAANPYNAFANAQMVRGQAASPAFAAYGTPGSGQAYGYQDQPEQAMPRITLPQMSKTFGQPNSAYPKIRPPGYNSPPPPNWINFAGSVKPPGG